MDYMLETSNADLLELCQVFRADLALRQGHVTEADLWARTHPPYPSHRHIVFTRPSWLRPKCS